ncbi:hypothetical protein SPONN_2795 [uncultured Candidatus Thioglobus sp.]|nr:hypothetical protein SPONN_2795 [uncultured Candidatus Thioglobus sp.]
MTIYAKVSKHFLGRLLILLATALTILLVETFAVRSREIINKRVLFSVFLTNKLIELLVTTGFFFAYIAFNITRDD